MVQGNTTNFGSKNGKKMSMEKVVNKINQKLKYLNKNEPSCSIMDISFCCTGDGAKVVEHCIFLYFFLYKNKRSGKERKSVLIIDPQGFNHLNSELVDTINNAAKKNEANLYFSQNIIQQEVRSSKETCKKLYSIFNGIGDRYETLRQSLKKGENRGESRRLSDLQENYVLCTLDDLIPHDLINDLTEKEQKDVNEKKTKKKHLNKNSKDRIITETETSDPVEKSKTQDYVLETPKVENEKQYKVIKKRKKNVKLQLDYGRTKDPKKELSNAEQREHQHIRENVKRVDKNHDECIKTQGNQSCLQKFNPCLTLLIFVCVSGTILFSIFLCTGVTKKEVSITGLCNSLIILACTVLAICLIKSREEKVGPKIDDLSVQAELQSMKSCG